MTVSTVSNVKSLRLRVSTVKKILILSANPTDTDKLRLDEEVGKIQSGLERAKLREQFEIIDKWAVRPDDLRRALLDHKPQIVHFCGHGSGEGGLALEDDLGQVHLVSTRSLAGLFKLCQDTVECVLLNACYSEAQALAIHQHIDYVIGMSRSIGDKAAIKFAMGFYDALGAGRSIEDAYEFGCNAIDLESIPEFSTPVIKSRKNTLVVPTLPKGTADDLEQDEIKNSLSNSRNLILLDQVQQERVKDNQSKPLPTLEQPDGQVSLESNFYVERSPIEADCYETILKPGALIRVKAPRQMGKTSLMTRILHHASQQGYQVASLNFQLVDAESLNSLDLFLQWFCTSITYEMNLPDKLSDYWNSILGSKNKCTNYFGRYLLAEINSPLALGLDEVDEIFKHPQIAADFFGLLRAWHERAKNEAVWKKLRLVIAHSKEVYIPLNINQSPFNIGLPVDLPDLNFAQVQDLVQRHGLNWTEEQLKQLMTLLSGHPYLLRVALYEIARGRMTLEKLKQIAPTEEGPYCDHLRRHLRNLQDDAQLLAAVKEIVTTNTLFNVGSVEAFKLRSMGLVKFQGNKVLPLCELYRQYFRDHLGVN